MSRIEEAIDELRSSGCAPRVFVTELCNLVATTQNLQAAFVEFSSQFEQRVSKNVSGKSSIELLTLYASSSKTGSHNESKVGLTVPFINACPCTQRWAMRDFYGVLKKRGFEESDAAELTLAAPFQAHTNRGAATVTIQDNTVEYRDLYGVLDRSVPIIRELLKGADEHALVSRAQRDGQFCEDNIRSVLVELVRTFGTSLLDSVSVDVSVEVDESVHFHNLWANVSDSYGAIRSLVAGAAADF